MRPYRSLPPMLAASSSHCPIFHETFDTMNDTCRSLKGRRITQLIVVRREAEREACACYFLLQHFWKYATFGGCIELKNALLPVGTNPYQYTWVTTSNFCIEV